MWRDEKKKPHQKEEVWINQGEKVSDFVGGFRNLSKDEQKEAMKNLMLEFCQIAMEDKSFIQEMMPRCMEMMKEVNFPMEEMMSKMMGKV